jgi:hypothetical protein
MRMPDSNAMEVLRLIQTWSWELRGRVRGPRSRVMGVACMLVWQKAGRRGVKGSRRIGYREMSHAHPHNPKPEGPNAKRKRGMPPTQPSPSFTLAQASLSSFLFVMFAPSSFSSLFFPRPLPSLPLSLP